MDLGFVTAPGGARFTVANQYAYKFKGLLADLEAAGYGIKGDQSGGYNPRNIAGTNTPSRHAYGAAIDVNWTDNPRGGMGQIPAELARSLAQKYGLVWGGDWKNPDPMHFEVSGQPGHTYGDGHNHGAPVQGQQQPTAAQGTVPMADQMSGPNPSFLQQLINPTVMAGLAGLESAWRGGSASEGMQTGLKTGLAQQAAQQQQAQRAAIAKMLSSPESLGNIPPALVRIAQATGDVGPLAAFLTKQADPNAGRTDDIKEYEYALQRGFKGSLQDWMINKRTTQGEYNKVPVYGTRIGPDGKPQTVMLQAGSRGDAVETKLPEGVTVNAQKPIEIDAGTHTVLLDPITRTPIANIPKNVGEASRQRAVGTAQGEAQVNLPATESMAENVLSYIDAIERDPNLDKVIGSYGGRTYNLTESARTAQSKIDQLSGQAFLLAFERLKGAGAITEREGAAAAAALTRLKEQVQSGKDYRAALEDFRREVRRMVDVARRKAGGVSQQPPQQQQPNAGWSVREIK